MRPAALSGRTAHCAPSRLSQAGAGRAAADGNALGAANERWSLDFVADQITDGWRFRILEVYDDCTRKCLALVADTSIGGRRVARELDAISRWPAKPATMFSDNGTELTSNAILQRANDQKVA